jgi:hypothetical protein
VAFANADRTACGESLSRVARWCCMQQLGARAEGGGERMWAGSSLGTACSGLTLAAALHVHSRERKTAQQLSCLRQQLTLTRMACLPAF